MLYIELIYMDNVSENVVLQTIHSNQRFEEIDFSVDNIINFINRTIGNVISKRYNLTSEHMSIEYKPDYEYCEITFNGEFEQPLVLMIYTIDEFIAI